MKKTLVFFALAFISIANAQKGTILVAGSVGINSSKEIFANSENTNNSITISPKVGYQFNDKWTVGVETSILNVKYANHFVIEGENITNQTKQKGFSAGGFVRYTKPLSEIFSIYADLGVGFHNTRRTNDYYDGISMNTATSKENGFYTGVTPALAINFTKGFGLNFNIGGLGYRTTNYENSELNNFYLNFGQAFNIGISKNF